MAAVSADLHHLQCRAPEFLLACPQGRLASAALALDYFCLSPFFDKASSNAQLRMQMAFSRGGMDGVDEHAELAYAATPPPVPSSLTLTLSAPC